MMSHKTLRNILTVALMAVLPIWALVPGGSFEGTVSFVFAWVFVGWFFWQFFGICKIAVVYALERLKLW